MTLFKQKPSPAMIIAKRPLMSIVKAGRTHSDTCTECSSDDSSCTSMPAAIHTTKSLDRNNVHTNSRSLSRTLSAPLPEAIPDFMDLDISMLDIDTCSSDDSSWAPILMSSAPSSPTQQQHKHHGRSDSRVSLPSLPEVAPLCMDAEQDRSHKIIKTLADGSIVGDRKRYVSKRPTSDAEKIHVGAMVGQSNLEPGVVVRSAAARKGRGEEEKAVCSEHKSEKSNATTESTGEESFSEHSHHHKYFSNLLKPVRKLVKKEEPVVTVRAGGRLV